MFLLKNTDNGEENDGIGRLLCLRGLWRAELPRVLSVLTDLVVIPRIHTNDHAVGRFEVFKGKLECLLNRLPVITFSTRREDLEAQAGLLNLLDHFKHIERVRGKERIADLNRDHGRHFFHFLRCPCNIVEASHKHINLPAFIGYLLDAIWIVGRNTCQNASIVNTFDKIVDLLAFALSKPPVSNPAVMDNCNGLSVFDNLLDRSALWLTGMKADELHL